MQVGKFPTLIPGILVWDDNCACVLWIAPIQIEITTKHTKSITVGVLNGMRSGQLLHMSRVKYFFVCKRCFEGGLPVKIILVPRTSVLSEVFTYAISGRRNILFWN